MKLILCVLLVSLATGAFAQRRVDVTNDPITLQTGPFFQEVQGVPFITTTYFRPVEGSRFFREEWMKGSAALNAQKEYPNLWLKLDLVSHNLHFKDVKGAEMICNTPVYSIKLKDSATGQEYRFVHSSFIPAAADIKPHVWMEVLADGKAQLYCQHKKNITETRPYGSATLEQRVFTSDLYYLVIDNRLIRVKRLQDIASELPDKKQEVQQWLRSNPGEKNVQNFAKLVAYYNSLFN